MVGGDAQVFWPKPARQLGQLCFSGFAGVVVDEAGQFLEEPANDLHMLGADFTAPLRGRGVQQHRLRGSPVIDDRGPKSSASWTRRLASAAEIRNNVDNADANDDSPNSSMGTSASDRDHVVRPSRATDARRFPKRKRSPPVQRQNRRKTQPATLQTPRSNAAMRFEPATELILRTLVRITDK